MQNKLKILVIDDEPDLCFMVKKNLEQTGKFEVFTANSGKQGMLLAGEKQPDLIFLDLMMPEICGSDLAILLQENPLTCNIPVIFLTAVLSSKELRVKDFHKIGDCHYMAKPASQQKILKGISAVLG